MDQLQQPREDERQRRYRRSVELSREVIEECRVQLMLKFRFLDFALWRMPLEPLAGSARYALATNGKQVFFEPSMVLGRFEESFEEAVRDYLHLVMHCVFRQPFDKSHPVHDAWWLACDVFIENVVMEMCGGRFESADDAHRRQILSELTLAQGKLTPAKLYTLFERAIKGAGDEQVNGMPAGGISEIAFLFERDGHEAWPSFAKEQAASTPGDIQDIVEDDPACAEEGETPDNALHVEGEAELAEGDEQRTDERPQEQGAEAQGDEGTQAEESDDAQDASPDAETDRGTQGEEEHASGADSADEVADEEADAERDWEEIAKQIEMNLETFSREWSDEAGSLIAALSIANQKVHDYSEFLQKFMTMTEEMLVNDDEFDYVFYTYGLKLYGNMPLVEPLEYVETQRIREFAIVIDTSESVRGDLVRRFLEHTFELLKKSETYGSEVNIHVIQCDAKVQSDTKIADLREVDALMEKFYIRGFGGTDFRPAFDYIESLRKQGEFTDLRGLLYFTDGFGTFPERMPDYETAFVFMDLGEEHIPPVPPWAMKVVIDERGIDQFKSSL